MSNLIITRLKLFFRVLIILVQIISNIFAIYVYSNCHIKLNVYMPNIQQYQFLMNKQAIRPKFTYCKILRFTAVEKPLKP